jgi:hypothetical protein
MATTRKKTTKKVSTKNDHSILTAVFLREATERAIKTFAQTFLSLTVAQSFFNAFSADWQTLIGVSLGATVLSYATSVVSANVGPEKGNPSLVKETNV